MPNLTKNNLALNRSDAKRKTWSLITVRNHTSNKSTKMVDRTVVGGN